MKNELVAEMFVNGHGADVKGSNMYSEGNVLYSYGPHFPLCIRCVDGTFLVNGDSYSPTTGKHRFYVVSEILIRSRKVYYTDTETMKRAAEKECVPIRIMTEPKTDGELYGVVTKYLVQRGISGPVARSKVLEIAAWMKNHLFVKEV